MFVFVVSLKGLKMDTATFYMTAMPSTPDPSVQHSTDNTGPLSNPLYFKTPLIPFLAAWPITIMCLIIYSYNLVRYKHSTVTIPLIFFPLLLFSGILDNMYDFETNADINEYKSKNLLAMILVLTVLAVLSVVYVIYYSARGIQNRRGYQLLSQTADDDEENTVLYARGDTEDRDMAQITSRPADTEKWFRIIDEYMTANVMWALTTYNILLVVIYIARYITHKDDNIIRELDVGIISLGLLAFLVAIAIIDFFLFTHPPNGSVFMHYAIVAVFALNFTIDFYAQVKYCEIITITVFFIAAFCAVYKIKKFVDIGVAPTKKTN